MAWYKARLPWYLPHICNLSLRRPQQEYFACIRWSGVILYVDRPAVAFVAV